MKAENIDGKAMAGEIEAGVKEGVIDFKKKFGFSPGLATLLIGDDPASRLYVSLKKKACDRVGIIPFEINLPEDISQESLLDRIRDLNGRPEINGILVQLPLPGSLDTREIINSVHPKKDVDGFHPVNMGKLVSGEEALVPCTPMGIIIALERMGVELKGKNVTIISHSIVVGKPMALLFLNRDATVSVCHVFTGDLKGFTINADILVAAAGKKWLINKDFVKEGAIVFDVGINLLNGKIYGDVHPDVWEKAGAVTPVPGGVGPLTIAMLMKQTLKAAGNQMVKN